MLTESEYLNFKKLYKEAKEAYEKYKQTYEYEHENKDEEYRNYMLIHQFDIPRRIQHIARRYGDILTYNQIAKLYETSVSDILNIYNVECIIDLPFGKGLIEAAYRWEEKLGEAKKKVIKNE